MKKLFLVLVAVLMMASSAYAWVETADNGPQQITTCWMEGTELTLFTSGSVVVLQTAAGTELPGKAVTGSTTLGNRIYGVIVGNYSDIDTVTEAISGAWVRVQTAGYVPIIKLNSDICTIGQSLYCSATVGRASINSSATAAGVSGNSVCFTSRAATSTNANIAGWLN